jgi:hypothetical protein
MGGRKAGRRIDMPAGESACARRVMDMKVSQRKRRGHGCALSRRLKDQLNPPVLRAAGQGVVRGDETAGAASLDAQRGCQPRVDAEQVVANCQSAGEGQ